MAVSVVLVASVLQLLLGATFLVVPYGAHRHGDAAQRAAEEQVAEQGFDPELLVRHRVVFTESASAAMFPVAIGLILVALGVFDLAGSGIGRIVAIVVQSVLFLGGGLVTGSQVFAVRFIERAFVKSDDRILCQINVRAFVAAAREAFPRWLRMVIPIRFVLITLGSLVSITLLAQSWVNPYFR
jgi:hypothetical protein